MNPSFPSSLGYDKPKNKDFHRFKALAAKQRLPDSELAVSLEEC
jgi:hypothetical protein